MVCNKVVIHRKVIFSYFDFYYQNQIIFWKFLYFKWYLALLSIIQNTRTFKNYLILIRKVKKLRMTLLCTITLLCTMTLLYTMTLSYTMTIFKKTVMLLKRGLPETNARQTDFIILLLRWMNYKSYLKINK